ncbi:hypothetical protein ABBZ27_09920 [Acinetobacter baumannii]|uniref:hypothetical protein n=1 Tax=Acinetobacter baumannii TaxID=470 RepID=UPI0002BA2C1C|nr:hypothetical protein [Acinetobacter baumannii]
MKYQIQPTQVPDDLSGCWFHPDIEQHDTIGDHAEFYTKEQWAQLQKNLGISILIERFDYMEIEEIPDEDSSDWSKWKPKAPKQNLFLIAAFDSEDGPILWWANPNQANQENLN